LVPTWITWADGKANVDWPKNDGCADTPRPDVLPPGTVIDRFGNENGLFFSPAGQGYHARAVPYVCARMDYRVYRVIKPLPIKRCIAAAWFGEPGGAVQLETTEPASQLRSEGALEVVSSIQGGSSGPAPQCAGT
jgi:hypothetical protein